MRVLSERPRITHTVLILISMALIVLSAVNDAASVERRQRGMTRRDKCPVCGMFVYKYPKWVAKIEFQDGHAHFYDGAKDMFKHHMNLSKYTPGRSQHEIAAVFVTDYYAVDLIDAKEAFYVIGSDILGPMGHELIPFKDEASAKEFLEDHKGTRILRFTEVTAEVIDALDAAQQERGRKR